MLGFGRGGPPQSRKNSSGVISQLRVVSGRRDVSSAVRLGMQSATCTYAREKTTDRSASFCMCGVCMWSWPYGVISGRMSSIAIINTLSADGGAGGSGGAGFRAQKPLPGLVVRVEPEMKFQR